MVGCNGASGPQLLNDGINALNKQQYDEAITLLNKATDRLPKSAEAYNYLGAAYQGKGDQTAAVRAFEKSIELDGEYAPARFNLGVILLERQQYDKAIVQLSKFVSLEPDNVEGYFYLASAQFQADDLRNAHINYLKVVETDPNRPEVLNNLGVISAKLDDAPQAETWFVSCIKTDPKYAPAFLNIAILYHHTLNKPAAALDYYEKFLELEPAGPSSERAKVAINEIRKGRTPVARAEKPSPPKPAARVAEAQPPAPPPPTTSTAPVPPPSPEPPIPTAAAAPTLAGPRWPTPVFAKPVPGKRQAAMLQFNRGAQYQRDKLLDAAIYCYREAIKLDPTLTAAYYNLGTALQTQGMVNQAVEAYQRALSLQPNFPQARLNLAILFESQGYLEDAAEQYRSILKDEPNDATAHLALGRLYWKFESTRAFARPHYERYLQLAPDTDDAKRVQRLLR